MIENYPIKAEFVVIHKIKKNQNLTKTLEDVANKTNKGYCGSRNSNEKEGNPMILAAQ